MPMMPFMGVRISWLIAARKRDLARSAACASSRAAASSAWAARRSVMSLPTICNSPALAEAGSTALTTLPTSFDSLQECIAASAPLGTAYCERFYEPVPDLLDPDIRPYKLKALRFADDEHPEVQSNFDAGPAAWASDIIESGEFHQVAVEHLFIFFMKREPDLDKLSPTFEGDELELIGENFREHDDITQAVREILALPAYRRAR